MVFAFNKGSKKSVTIAPIRPLFWIHVYQIDLQLVRQSGKALIS